MPEMEKELRTILKDSADSRDDDYKLHQSTEHSYWSAIADIEKTFKKYGYVVNE